VDLEIPRAAAIRFSEWPLLAQPDDVALSEPGALAGGGGDAGLCVERVHAQPEFLELGRDRVEVGGQLDAGLGAEEPGERVTSGDVQAVKPMPRPGPGLPQPRGSAALLGLALRARSSPPRRQQPPRR
jgi:hypothetical protein